MTQPFADDKNDVRQLKRCFGTLFIDKVYNQIERERWFIDNVKPIARVIKLGLANDFGFIAGALTLIARFLVSSFTYLCLDPSERGAYRVTLRNWSAEWDGPTR